jgi:hypothetical protein
MDHGPGKMVEPLPDKHVGKIGIGGEKWTSLFHLHEGLSVIQSKGLKIYQLGLRSIKSASEEAVKITPLRAKKKA